MHVSMFNLSIIRQWRNKSEDSQMKKFIAIGLVALSLAACGETAGERATSGAIIGAGTGAVLGGLVTGRPGGALLGGAVGAASGAVIGANTAEERQRRERLECWINRYGEEVCRVLR